MIGEGKKRLDGMLFVSHRKQNLLTRRLFAYKITSIE